MWLTQQPIENAIARIAKIVCVGFEPLLQTTETIGTAFDPFDDSSNGTIE